MSSAGVLIICRYRLGEPVVVVLSQHACKAVPRPSGRGFEDGAKNRPRSHVDNVLPNPWLSLGYEGPPRIRPLEGFCENRVKIFYEGQQLGP